MKSTDKYMLVLVASLALLLAGCGGGSSSTPTTPTTPPVNPGPTPSDQLATANKIIMLHEEASGATADAEAAGAETIPPRIRVGAGGARIAFLHPRSLKGVLLEKREDPEGG